MKRTGKQRCSAPNPPRLVPNGPYHGPPTMCLAQWTSSSVLSTDYGCDVCNVPGSPMGSSCGKPNPLTVRDAFELVKFDAFLRIASEKKAAGATRDEAQRAAYRSVYPESEVQ